MFFYLYCGWGFKCLYGGRTKGCLISWTLYDNPENSLGNTKGCEMEDRREGGSGSSSSSDSCDG